VVLRRRAHHGGAADIDFLDGVGILDAGLRNGLLEGVEVDDHEIDGPDGVRLEILTIFGQIPTGQDSPMDLGMQGLHPAPEHLGALGQVGDIRHRQPGFPEGGGRSSRGHEFDAEGSQSLSEIHQTGFIRDREQRTRHRAQRIRGGHWILLGSFWGRRGRGSPVV